MPLPMAWTTPPGLYAVYDLGGGSRHLVVAPGAWRVRVVATGGDAALGGDGFDRLLADWALAQSGLCFHRAGTNAASWWRRRASAR